VVTQATTKPADLRLPRLRDCVVWMTDVAAFVSTAYIIDHRFRPLVLDFQRGNERILCRDCHAVSLTINIDADREFEPHARISLTTRVRPGHSVARMAGQRYAGVFAKAAPSRLVND
jgi:hypothetical protein